jgi:hypothetical protein
MWIQAFSGLEIANDVAKFLFFALQKLLRGFMKSIQPFEESIPAFLIAKFLRFFLFVGAPLTLLA